MVKVKSAELAGVVILYPVFHFRSILVKARCKFALVDCRKLKFLERLANVL